MKDVFGIELGIGDIVAFNPPRYKGLILGKVVAFTSQMVRVEYTWQGRPNNTVVYARDLAKRMESAPKE